VSAHPVRGRRGVVRLYVAFLALTVALPATGADPVREAVEKVSVKQYQAYEVSLENMGLGLYGGPTYNQHYRSRDGWAGGGTLGNQEARLYLTDQFTLLGLTVFTQGVYRNVVAEWPGLQTPQQIYIVCAHYDTTSGGERPGGDDNASGTAGILEAARVLTQYQFQSTLRFIAFNAEEDWMRGSQEYVNALPKDASIAGVINLDMILRPAWDSNALEVLDLDLETLRVPLCTAWTQAFIDAAAAYVPSLVIDPNSLYPPRWDAGDHGPFIAAGYAAFGAIENTAEEIWYAGSNTYYHSAQDASDALANDANSPSGVTYDYAFAADVVKATVATVTLHAGLIPPADPNAAAPPLPTTDAQTHGENNADTESRARP
jgi:hypothetical protein